MILALTSFLSSVCLITLQDLRSLSLFCDLKKRSVAEAAYEGMKGENVPVPPPSGTF